MKELIEMEILVTAEGGKSEERWNWVIIVVVEAW